ncbi:MAG: hypothetical protein M1831_000819 [Alyxoria varia]|nr:MAG: hypothetical protein M1831_000819 [Alyxoria varia]
MGAIDTARQKILVEAANAVSSRVAAANTSSRNVRLVLVSKLKPATDILSLHSAPPYPAHFGENYLQELQQKAKELPRTINWHFIGALQTNKCKTLAADVPGLWCVSSVDSSRKADALEKGRVAAEEKPELHETNKGTASNGDSSAQQLPRLRIHVQVNTSGEENKSGVEPSETTSLCQHVRKSCPHLQLAGLMTIGAIARSQATTMETENEDFIALKQIRDKVCEELEIGQDQLELSMGMSEDFEGAIRLGSDEVRVGSTIFGARPPKGEAKSNEA